MQFDDLNGFLKGAGTLRLAQSWLGWRGDRLLPLKSAMQLRDIRSFLPWVGLLEILDRDAVRLRVAGTALAEIYGVDMTGRNLKDVTRPADWPTRSARYGGIAQQPCGSFFTRVDTLPDGKVVAYETVALPLDVDAAGSARQIIYCVAPLHESFADDRPAGPRVLPMSQAFEFIDIGAGLPDAA